MQEISRAKLLAAATTVLVLLLACNLELLPLALLVDTIGLDVLALLLGAQLVAVLPWLRAHAAAALRITALAGDRWRDRLGAAPAEAANARRPSNAQLMSIRPALRRIFAFNANDRPG